MRNGPIRSAVMQLLYILLSFSSLTQLFTSILLDVSQDIVCNGLFVLTEWETQTNKENIITSNTRK